MFLRLLAAFAASLILALLARAEGQGATAQVLLQQVDDFPHALRIEHSVAAVQDYEVGLGTLKKVRGVWQFKDSERRSGELTRYTWQIVDGFTSVEVLDGVEEYIADLNGARQLFACDGRSCGHGAQWANRVFGQRLLYGREDMQRYRVFALGVDGEQRILFYAAARTADRQYLHAEWLR